MNRFNAYFLGLILAVTFVFQSCDDDKGYSLDNYTVAMATVERSGDSSYPYLLLDNGKTVWLSASQVPFSKLPAGQRMAANLTLLADNQDGFDYLARLNSYYLVLTKNIIKLDEANQDSIGNDKVGIVDMWVGGNYLNIEFSMYVPSTEKHMVNLVDNTIEEHPSDGYAYLGFRYNAMGDENQSHVVRQLVSFNLGDVSPANKDVKGLKISVYNRKTGKEEVITLDYATAEKDERSFDLQGLSEGNVD